MSWWSRTYWIGSRKTPWTSPGTSTWPRCRTPCGRSPSWPGRRRCWDGALAPGHATPRRERLTAAMAARLVPVGSLTHTHIANLMWAFDKLGHADPETFRMCADILCALPVCVPLPRQHSTPTPPPSTGSRQAGGCGGSGDGVGVRQPAACRCRVRGGGQRGGLRRPQRVRRVKRGQPCLGVRRPRLVFPHAPVPLADRNGRGPAPAGCCGRHARRTLPSCVPRANLAWATADTPAAGPLRRRLAATAFSCGILGCLDEADVCLLMWALA